MGSLRDWQAVLDQPIEPLTPGQRHQAALAVCQAAHDADDARLLLDMLGLEDA